MTLREGTAPDSAWFRSLLDTAEEVYFRYALLPTRGFVYLSPSVRSLTGKAPEAFYDNAALCLGLIARDDRRILRQVLRARRGLDATVRLVRDGATCRVELRTVAVIRGRRVVAVEGMLRLSSGGGAAAGEISADGQATATREPTPQRLAALMYEVHELLHRVLPARQRQVALESSNVVRVGQLALDLERLTVSEAGTPVSLTSRELLVLRYLLLRPGRVVTRSQLLTDVWGYRYTGDDRTVDVHVSRLRRKLPSLGARLVAVKHVGYRLDADEVEELKIANS